MGKDSLKIALPELEPDMHNYLEAIRAAGMEPVQISSLRQILPDRWTGETFADTDGRVMPAKPEMFDGLLLPGGVDIDPARYGRENEGSVGICRELDELQFTLLDWFVRMKKPVFGICRGHQLINVYFGGTLIQHLPTADAHARDPEEEPSLPAGRGRAPDRRNVSRNREGSWIASVYGEVFAHNSSHHQAVERPGRGLIVDSYCVDDDVVEAMHHESLPVFSVQWHPERMCLAKKRDDMADGLPVLAFFRELAACSRRGCGGT